MSHFGKIGRMKDPVLRQIPDRGPASGSVIFRYVHPGCGGPIRKRFFEEYPLFDPTFPILQQSGMVFAIETWADGHPAVLPVAGKDRYPGRKRVRARGGPECEIAVIPVFPRPLLGTFGQIRSVQKKLGVFVRAETDAELGGFFDIEKAAVQNQMCALRLGIRLHPK